MAGASLSHQAQLDLYPEEAVNISAYQLTLTDSTGDSSAHSSADTSSFVALSLAEDLLDKDRHPRPDKQSELI